MRLQLVLTVQPREGRMRFYNAVVDAPRAPSVGDDVALARYAGSTPDSSPLTARVTAVQWTDLSFEAATVFLRADDAAVSLDTLLQAERWTDEDPD